MSDHLIAEAHRHAMALPTTHPTHADIAWYVREVSGLRAELALLREWQREVIQNANAHHAERKDAIARAERAEAELASERGRLDYLSTRGFEHRHHETGDHLGYEWTISSYSESEDVTLRDVIDAEMREDEK